MHSIERYLLAWMVGALSLGLVLIVLVTYVLTLAEMNEVFDADLRNVATAIATYHRSGHLAAPVRDAARSGAARSSDDTIIIQAWTSDRRKLYASDPQANLPVTETAGLSRVRASGVDWIVYTLVEADGIVQAAQPTAARQEMAQEAAVKILPPMLVLVLVVSALVIFALRRGLRSLDSAARDVAARSEASLEPIPTSAAPREIMPLVSSVNALMNRLAIALSAQRRFLADAAHELRTPATALRLQLQLLKRSADDATRARAMVELESGIDRSQRLIEQLLQVSRFGVDGEPMRVAPVDLSELVRSVVGTLSVKADACGIDLGARARGALVVRGDREQLTVLLNNLVENALRHTPEGGVVDVEAAICDDRPELRVIDTGPGIPVADRERVFERFQRGMRAATTPGPDGSGLGLAIVRAIAEQHAASVALHTPESGKGLEVRVAFRKSSASE